MTDSNATDHKVSGKTWQLYMIQTRLNTLYTGITTDVSRRFAEHNSSSKRSARYLKGKGPLVLVWHQDVRSKSDALTLEYRVKQLSKQQKLSLIAGTLSLDSLRVTGPEEGQDLADNN
ncbi:GIY-YIG nuclease family protein [Marinomonas sp. A79]|uniref:GIY-YIG nuclease family protein n=1 Tax=Marinomonas vulgaris TaxID=2823372 RepID=A0ABS5HE78_9GAMM|nr:GIY-YIG nuclease family protein [Marinomonas vulgaris]MBR7889817.1 GIY-YIG nuclease family protein [Marinomonas vulgaris]